MLLKPFATALIMTIFSCNGIQSRPNSYTSSSTGVGTGEEWFKTIASIPAPEAYYRVSAQRSSFTEWLRNISLKQDKTVYLYNGELKRNQSAQFAVLDISVGNTDLQQCADAAMRLRAEYQFAQKTFDQISFTDNEGTVYHFKPPYNRDNFNTFLNRVFGMCGTASLSKQMRTIGLQQLKPGDLLLKGGFPGHAVMVVDMAENDKGEKLYLLAQSYMPAQDIHVLVNPNSENLSPWYKLEEGQLIETPEWTFSSNQLKTW